MISLLVVNYRSAALTREAIRTARAATRSPLQVVVVDNSVDPVEAEALQGVADALIVSETNRGYAGGINLGRLSCAGDVLLVSNPDVTFDGQAIDLLAGALSGAAAAGPALCWDAERRWMLPPGEVYTARQRLDAILASRSPSWRRERDRRRFLDRLRFWTRQATAEVSTLSGAVMAIRADVFDAAGGFDERFPLYFEETDFLRRLSEAGERIVYVPEAHCRHLHNQSAVQIGSLAAQRYALSEKRYLEKWNGPFLAGVLKRLERPMPAEPAEPAAGPVPVDGDDVVVEASPLASFDTAAGCFPEPHERQIDVPPNAWTAPVIYLRTVRRRTGEVIATYARRRT